MSKKIIKLSTPNLQNPLNGELLGSAIKARRTQSNLRQEDAASLCGVAKQTYMQIEHGNPNSKLETILKVCSGLGVNLYIESWDADDNDWQ